MKWSEKRENCLMFYYYYYLNFLLPFCTSTSNILPQPGLIEPWWTGTYTEEEEEEEEEVEGSL